MPPTLTRGLRPPARFSTRQLLGVSLFVRQARWLSIPTETTQKSAIPFGRRLEEGAKRHPVAETNVSNTKSDTSQAILKDWELTVGIEIHAQLNTERKLFSSAVTSVHDNPNDHAAIFDLALPGSQPNLQTAALLPALRAAAALRCVVQQQSKFDRKHYFYQDQPAGYQITQYYEPFATDGTVRLDVDDGIAIDDGDYIEIGIKQIQLEQDTAKTIQRPPDTTLLDFNRVGYSLIEIISLPQMHHPKTAAAYVRKVQNILQAVNSVNTGMEMGGLRADVNVSVRRRNVEGGKHSYHGVTGLGQKTEIKNLSSFKAVEDAIIAERDRQITLLQAGVDIKGETRGWSIGSVETRRLRGKEGEVDYRYMPDPDVPLLSISRDLIDYVSATLPMLPDEQVHILTKKYGLPTKDAKTLIFLEDGTRLEYFDDVLGILLQLETGRDVAALGRIVSNWVLHDLGGLLSSSELEFSKTCVAPKSLALIIEALLQERITGKTAKQLLSMIFNGDDRTIPVIIKDDSLEFRHLSSTEYHDMAKSLIEENADMAAKVRKGQMGKLQWFVGQMLRKGQGRVDAQKAADALRPLLLGAT